MIDIGAAISLAVDAAGKASPAQTLADADMLYDIYASAKSAGKLDVAAMQKAGTLKPAVDALARTSTLLSTLMNDPTTGPKIAALLGSLE